MICLLGIDLIFNFFIHFLGTNLCLSTVFLFYLAFRKGFRELFLTVFIFSLLAAPFTSLEAFHIFFSYFLVLGVLFLLRVQIYTESYLTNAIWVTGMNVCLNWFVKFSKQGYHLELFSFRFLIEELWNAMIIFAVVIPLFIFFDKVYKRFGKIDTSRGSGDSLLYQ